MNHDDANIIVRYDNLARSLAMMEDELRRADERVKNAESRVRFGDDDVGPTLLVMILVMVMSCLQSSIVTTNRDSFASQLQL